MRVARELDAVISAGLRAEEHVVAVRAVRRQLRVELELVVDARRGRIAHAIDEHELTVTDGGSASLRNGNADDAADRVMLAARLEGHRAGAEGLVAGLPIDAKRERLWIRRAGDRRRVAAV